MLFTNNQARRGVSILATLGLTGAMLLSQPVAANAAATVVDFASTDAANYTYLKHTGGAGGTDWAPWADNEGLNAPWVTGSANWKDRTGWAAHNFVVQDDGSGTNNALWVQKAKAGCPTSGIQVAQLDAASSLITSANKVITVKVKAADDSVAVRAVLTDSSDGNELVVNATAATKDTYNTVSFDFGSPASGSFDATVGYSKLSLIFDPANLLAGGGTDWAGCGDGAGVSKAYIVDDLTYTVGAATPPPPPVANPYQLTFEDSDMIGQLAVGDPAEGKWPGAFEGGGTGTAVPATAHTGKALEFNKAAAGNPWSGVNLFEVGTGERISDATFKSISFDYFSPDSANSPVMLKILDKDGGTLRKTFSAAPGWGTYTVDLSTITGAGGTWSADTVYKKITLFPDFADGDVAIDGVSAAPMTSQKYYIDNLVVNGWGLATKVSAGTLSGTAKVGKTLTATAGTWSGNGVTTAYKWFRCSVQGKSVRASAPVKADKCSVISGKTAATYKLTSKDKSKYIRVTVTATTAAGSVYSTSKSTAKVK